MGFFRDEDQKIFFVLLAALILVVGFFAFQAVTREPEKFTEVYLLENQTNAVIGESYSVKFAIVNNEGAQKTFTYIVSGSTEKKVTLSDKEKKELAETIVLANQGKQKVTIDVEDEDKKKNRLWFWVNVE